MNYINNHVKYYRRIYVRQFIKDLWDMQYAPATIAALIVVGIYYLATTKLIEYIIGGF